MEYNCLECMPLPKLTDEQRLAEIRRSLKSARVIVTNLEKEEKEVIEKLTIPAHG